MSKVATRYHQTIKSASSAILRYATAGCVALVLPLGLASCKAGDQNEKINEKANEFSNVKSGATLMQENGPVDPNSLRHIGSNELFELLANSQITTVSPDGKIRGPKYETFNQDGAWGMVSESKRLMSFTGKWKVEDKFYVVFDVKELNAPGYKILDSKRKIYTDDAGRYYSTVFGIQSQSDLRLIAISQKKNKSVE